MLCHDVPDVRRQLQQGRGAVHSTLWMARGCPCAADTSSEWGGLKVKQSNNIGMQRQLLFGSVDASVTTLWILFI